MRLGPAPVVRLERPLAHRKTPSKGGKGTLAPPTHRRPDEPTVAPSVGQTPPARPGSRRGQGDTPGDDQQITDRLWRTLDGGSTTLLAFVATGSSPRLPAVSCGQVDVRPCACAGDSPEQTCSLAAPTSRHRSTVCGCRCGRRPVVSVRPDGSVGFVPKPPTRDNGRRRSGSQGARGDERAHRNSCGGRRNRSRGGVGPGHCLAGR